MGINVMFMNYFTFVQLLLHLHITIIVILKSIYKFSEWRYKPCIIIIIIIIIIVILFFKIVMKEIRFYTLSKKYVQNFKFQIYFRNN